MPISLALDIRPPARQGCAPPSSLGFGFAPGVRGAVINAWTQPGSNRAGTYRAVPDAQNIVTAPTAPTFRRRGPAPCRAAALALALVIGGAGLTARAEATGTAARARAC